ncbi:sigma factor-like helix-turn-helix DNA-binding protein [Neobacillus sp. GCM10023253]|uniref:sigma factor-like helix-turn-helix DNA-binding protein n=1 Tax=Neobacillus sp. GCM10023253 TaxID=3252644 RepID=UPI00361F1AB3
MLHKLNPKVDEQVDSYWQEQYPKLKQYCHFLTQNTWDGDDIAHETYLKALKYENHPQRVTPALLNKIAYNHWVDVIRKRKKESIQEDTEFTGACLNVTRDQLFNTVEMLINHFTPKQSIIFLLKEAFQYQIKEIAEILNTSEMAVKANLHRAKNRLGKLKDEDQTPTAETYWNIDEREQLAELFYEALKSEDPTLLIERLSSFISEIPKAKFIQTFSPSSTLCMAA